MYTFIDVSFAIHGDMLSLTGGVNSIGTGAIFPCISKQKINTNRTTESEFVGASDYMPNSIWVKDYMGAQGHDF